MKAPQASVLPHGALTYLRRTGRIGGCSGAAVAVMPDASGNGYWLVMTQSGHVSIFGDTPYFGAPGPASVPVTSAVRTPDGRGYWILYANGALQVPHTAAFEARSG